MKIKALVSISLICLFTTASTYAGDYSYEYASGNSNRGYESLFGNKYEYDLSRPLDRIKYETDVKAQLRDSIIINPQRELEQDLGQYGGGLYRD